MLRFKSFDSDSPGSKRPFRWLELLSFVVVGIALIATSPVPDELYMTRTEEAPGTQLSDETPTALFKVVLTVTAAAPNGGDSSSRGSIALSAEASHSPENHGSPWVTLTASGETNTGNDGGTAKLGESVFIRNGNVSFPTQFSGDCTPEALESGVHPCQMTFFVKLERAAVQPPITTHVKWSIEASSIVHASEDEAGEGALPWDIAIMPQ